MNGDTPHIIPETEAERREREAREKAAQRARAKDVAIKSLALVGLIALLAIGTWGTVQILRNSNGIFSNLGAAVTDFTSRFFSGEEERDAELRLTLETQTVKNDEAFDLTWETRNDVGRAVYSLVYECANGLTFATEAVTGGTTRIPCGEPYQFSSDEKRLSLTPHSPTERFVEASLKLSLLDGESVRAEDSVLLTVAGDNLTAAPTTTPPAATPAARPTPSAPVPPSISYYPIYTTGPAASDPNGFVDLEVEILDIGTIDRDGDFRRIDDNDELDRDEKAGVRFVVRNIGTKTSDEWSFTAELPTSPRHTFRSRDQQELTPGSRMEFTLGFNRLSSSRDGEIVVEIDDRDDGGDTNERNNSDEIEVEISR